MPRLRRRTPQGRRLDRRSDMVRGAAAAVVVVGAVASALMAKAWQETIVRQHDDRLDRAASSRSRSSSPSAAAPSSCASGRCRAARS